MRRNEPQVDRLQPGGQKRPEHSQAPRARHNPEPTGGNREVRET